MPANFSQTTAARPYARPREVDEFLISRLEVFHRQEKPEKAGRRRHGTRLHGLHSDARY